MPVDELSALRTTGMRVVGTLAGVIGALLAVWALATGAVLVALAAMVLLIAPLGFAWTGRADPLARLLLGVTYPLLAALLLAMASSG